MESKVIGIVIYGFLTGFVGFASCFRLAEPIATWLMGKTKSPFLTGITNFLVLAFLIFSYFLLLSYVPHSLFLSDEQKFRNAFGFSWLGSFAGLFVFGVIRRLQNR